MNKNHEIIQKLIKSIVDGNSYGMAVIGEGGTGKTETIIASLTALKLKEGIHYHICSYATPRGIVGLLRATNELTSPRILIMDDVEASLTPASLGVLRQALWAINGKRKITWATNKNKEEFEFHGRIIFSLNTANLKNPIVRALLDRISTFELKLSNDEICELILKKANEDYPKISLAKRQEIAKFIIDKGRNSNRLSLRLLPKAFGHYLSSPNHWQTLTEAML